MCGIIGVFFRNPLAASPLSQEQVNRLRHRGPDAYGIYSNGPVSLGHRRLAILDLTEGGAQPKSTSDGRYTVTFNGEIYNYLELRQELAGHGISFYSSSDTEVLLAAYRVWGKKCVERFRGMFAFALYDRNEQTLFMARDRCGEKPFFFYRDRERFCFASELKGLLPLLPYTPSLNRSAIDLYLHYQYVPEPLTLLTGVRKLPAGHTLFLSVDEWDAEPECYWNVEAAVTTECDLVKPDEIPDLIRSRIEESVVLTLRSDVPVGLALSGGIDSGTIAALVRKHKSDQFHAFGVGYPGRPPYDERDQAKALAQQLQIEFHEIELKVDDFVNEFQSLVSIMDEPIADIAAFGHYAVPRAAADYGIKVLLSGTGGDEVFWGYPWVVHVAEVNEIIMKYPFLELLPLIPSWVPGRRWIRKILNRFSPIHDLMDIDMRRPPGQIIFYGMHGDFSYARSVVPRVYGQAMRSLPPDNPFLPMSGYPTRVKEIPSRIVGLLFATYLTSNCLALGDRVSMGCSVEMRLPFLDVRLIECVMSLRRRYSDHCLGHKAWLRAALKGVLPDEVLNRPKAGFQPPVVEWLSEVWKRYHGIVYESHLTASGIFDAPSLRELAGEAEKKDFSSLFFLYKILLLEMWYRLIVRREVF